MGWKSPFLADFLLSCWVKNFPILGRKFLFFSQFPTPFLGGFFSFSSQAFWGNVDAEKSPIGRQKITCRAKTTLSHGMQSRILGERV